MDFDWKHSGIAESIGIDTQDSWLRETLLNSLHSTEHFAKTFIPETFWRSMTPQHTEVWNMLDDDLTPKACACCYRSFGKSSMAEAKIIKGILFRQIHHAMILGSNHDTASEATENIKAELLANNAIREVFGNLKPKSRVDLPLSFSKKTFFLVDPQTGESMCMERV